MWVLNITYHNFIIFSFLLFNAILIYSSRISFRFSVLSLQECLLARLCWLSYELYRFLVCFAEDKCGSLDENGSPTPTPRQPIRSETVRGVAY